MRLLVAGADPVDAGKTTFAAGLAARLADTDSDAVDTSGRLRVFKPRAGNDFWFDHDDVRRATTEGRLYGKDVATLLSAAGSDARAEERNPVHRLWSPAPGETGMLGEQGRRFLIDRVRTPDGTAWVRNANATLPPLVRETLPVDEARPVESVSAFNGVMCDLHVPALERVASDVRAAGERPGDVALVESYGDVADPLGEVVYDAVAVVEPGRCRVYDGRRWGLAREAAAGGPAEGRLEEHVDRVTGMLDPVATRALAPLSGERRDRPEAIAAAYADAYDSLLATADTDN